MKKFREEEIGGFSSSYSEKGLWKKLKGLGKKVGLEIIKNVLILFYVLTDKNANIKERALIAGALGYFIFPVDAIPDFTPVIGFLDDASVVLLALKAVAHHIDDSIKDKVNNKLGNMNF